MAKAKKFILREGFWRGSGDDGDEYLPKVKARKGPWKGQKKFLKALAEVESKNHGNAGKYKGWSDCRCCGKHNGSAEYKVTEFGITWQWPSGYKHYIADHNVRPSLAFQEFILAAAQ